MKINIIVTVAAASTVAAQNKTISVNPNSVDLSTRAAWCTSEQNTCSQLCSAGGQSTKQNDCDTNLLTDSCLCTNGSSPGLQYYTQSLFSLVCQEAFNQCIVQNENNQIGQQTCKDNILSQCGTLDATKLQPATTSGSGTSSAASNTGSAASSAATASSTKSHNGAALPTAAKFIGNGAAVAAIGVFAYLV